LRRPGSYHVAYTNDLLTFRSIRNPGCNPKTLAGLDTVLEMVYFYDNHSGVQLINAYESARDFGEDRRHSEKAGNVSDRRHMT
jgi:hypothetical protein